jgi:hypothetical protein
VWPEHVLYNVKKDSNTNRTYPENEPQDLFLALSETLETGFEFLMARREGPPAALKRGEIKAIYENGRVFLECLTAEGTKTWRVISAESAGNKLILAVSGKFGSETEAVELVPRISAADLLAAIAQARLERAGRIAAVASAKTPHSKVTSIRLSKGARAGETGSNAQILLQIGANKQAAIFAQAAEKGIDPEGFLVAAISWFINIAQRPQGAKKMRTEKLWLIAGKRMPGKLKKVIALLKPKWRASVSLYEIDLENEHLREVKIPEFHRLWREKPRQLKIPAAQIPTEPAQKITALAPEAIDVTYSKHGENLRFHGLPFVRIRTLLGKEKTWFGIERKRRVLDEASREDLLNFVEELKENRSALTENKSHYYYRAAPEHWLESILRRDITRLDANLILSPIYHQFRASAEQIDLLALRRDGRLVVIELKVAPSRAAVFQAADYWRQIELQRRSGNLAKARAFGDLEIADEPALVLLAAPALSFHRDLEFWAGMISPKIEIYRYDLHENWRQDIKVIQRKRLVGV